MAHDRVAAHMTGQAEHHPDRVLISDLRCDAILGIYPEERTSPQPVVINLIVDTDCRPAARSQSIEDTLNYAEIAERAIELVVQGKYLLIESLVEDIAAMVLEHSRAEAVRVRVEKPEAVTAAGAVGVEITRRRPNL